MNKTFLASIGFRDENFIVWQPNLKSVVDFLAERMRGWTEIFVKGSIVDSYHGFCRVSLSIHYQEVDGTTNNMLYDVISRHESYVDK